MREGIIVRNIDWFTILLYVIMIITGWLNIYAVVYNPDPEVHQSIFSFSNHAGKQLIWMFTAFVLILIIFNVDYKVYNSLSYIMYAFFIVLLILTIFLAKADTKGSHSWLAVGPLQIQPAEFTKIFTALAIATYLGQIDTKMEQLKTKLVVIGMILLPMAIIILQNETGVALVYFSFVLVLFREGLSKWILILGTSVVALFIFALVYDEASIAVILFLICALAVGVYAILYGTKNKKAFYRFVFINFVFWLFSSAFVFAVDWSVNNILKPHQRTRIMVLFNPEMDKRGQGYQINQSLIAIGSGGFNGKGFLKGTQTKFDFVPEQHTDFIFCTIGEEHGWMGSTGVILIYLIFLIRLVFLAERQKDTFTRVFGYSVACVVFFHFLVNIGMTIGFFPIIGIPLPFYSYGGSSLWTFTIFLFIFLKLDSHRKQVLSH